jgi:tetratricopeptide (TPR) repeat protein
VVAADSTSTDGWYGLGDAWYHRAATEGTLMGRALGEAGPNAERQETVTQSYAPRLARAYASSRRAFERTIALDSSYHLAYSHLVSIYQMLAAGVTPLVLDGDSLRAVAGPAGVRAYGGQARVDSARARARAMATTAARGWAAADPDSPEAQFGLIGAFLAVGRPDSAVAAVDRALARPTLSSPALAYAAVSAQFAADPARVGRALARALARFPADSIRGRQEPQGTLGIYTQAAAAAAGVGRLADARAILAAGEAAVPAIHATGAEKQATRPILQWYAVALEVAAGLPAGPRIPRIAAGLRTAEAGVQRSAGPMYTPGVLSGLAPIAYTAYLATGDTTFAATVRRLTRATGTPSFPEIDALAALGRGDTAAAAAAIRTFPQPALPTTLGLSGLRAAARGDAMARAGDLRGALAWYAYLDPARFIGVGPYETGIAAYAGTLLTRGALYERLGDRGRAAEAYTRFLALRRDADSSFAAQVAAARAGLARVRDASGTSVPVSGAPAGR